MEVEAATEAMVETEAVAAAMEAASIFSATR
jgi:hypothetical protein